MREKREYELRFGMRKGKKSIFNILHLLHETQKETNKTANIHSQSR